MGFIEDSKRIKSYTEGKVKCKKCGHSQTMSKADRTICSWCNHWIYRTPAIELKYRLKEYENKRKTA